MSDVQYDLPPLLIPPGTTPGAELMELGRQHAAAAERARVHLRHSRPASLRLLTVLTLRCPDEGHRYGRVLDIGGGQFLDFAGEFIDWPWPPGTPLVGRWYLTCPCNRFGLPLGRGDLRAAIDQRPRGASWTPDLTGEP